MEQQICANCQYVSPEHAKFCRRCGEVLLIETAANVAETRNYGRQAGVASGLSAPLAAAAVAQAPGTPSIPSIMDAFGNDTLRQPGVQASTFSAMPLAPAGAGMPASLDTARLKFGHGKWRYVALVLALLAALGLGAALNESTRSSSVPVIVSPVDAAQLAAEEARLNAQQQITDAIQQAHERANETAERYQEALAQQIERAQTAAEAGELTVDGNLKAIDLTSFEYPNAPIGTYNRIPGRELLTQRLAADFSAICQHYEKRLGKPLLRINEGDRPHAIFQTGKPTSVSVLIERDGEFEGDSTNRWKITVVRSPFTFPQLSPPVSSMPSAPPPPPPAPVEPAAAADTKGPK